MKTPHRGSACLRCKPLNHRVSRRLAESNRWNLSERTFRVNLPRRADGGNRTPLRIPSVAASGSGERRDG